MTFYAPTELSFRDNYEETLAFILDFRRFFYERSHFGRPGGPRLSTFAEFASIEKIDAGAGLVLAAEIDRYFKHVSGNVRMYDGLWKENVRKFFIEAGLFELLGIDPEAIAAEPSPDPSRETLRFISAHSSSGTDAEKIRIELENLAEKSIGPRPRVYAAISEALMNVNHAYPNWYRSWPLRPSRRWWASGFWSRSSNLVGVQLYDQGAGIPATLPKQPHWQLISKVFPMLDKERSDSGRIAAALEYGRTSTGQPGRGKGLAEMADWIEEAGSGFLRILSGGGAITYRAGGNVKRKNFDAPFCGTLIEWEIPVD